MTRLSQTARSARPCTACGTQTRTGRTVEPLGFFGPECIHKVAALEAVVKRSGLESLLAGRVRVELIETTDAHGWGRIDYSADTARLKWQAEKIGLKWFAEQIGETLEADCWVQLPKGVEARRRLFGGLEALRAAA